MYVHCEECRLAMNQKAVTIFTSRISSVFQVRLQQTYTGGAQGHRCIVYYSIVVDNEHASQGSQCTLWYCKT